MIEGVSLAVRVPEGQLRFVPVEAIEVVAEPAREIRLRPSVEAHGFPCHRSLRRLEAGWRVDVSVDAPRMEPDYWLAHCRGFLVNSPGHDVGVVDDLIFEASGTPERLVVLAGGVRTRMLELWASEVVEIIPELRTICIRDADPGTERPLPVSTAWRAFDRRWSSGS